MTWDDIVILDQLELLVTAYPVAELDHARRTPPIGSAPRRPMATP